MSILLVFDVLANADTVTEFHDDISKPLFMYAFLRLPIIASLILPLTTLFATIVTLYQAVMSQEMVAMRASGMPVSRMLIMFLVPAVVIVTGHFALVNTLQPYAAERLAQWEKFDYRLMPPDSRKQNTAGWISIGNTFLQVQDSSPDGKFLEDIDVVARTPDGILIDYFTASSARYHDSGWTFHNIERGDFGRNVVTTIPEMRVALPIKPKIFSTLVSNPEELNLKQLHRLGNEQVMQKKPAYTYQLWFHRKIAYPLSSIIMILLAMPLVLRLSRGGTAFKTVTYICITGFAFIILERLFQTLGADGSLSPLLAAWSPLMLFSVLGSWAVLMQEG